jgi:hypothetical protein
MAPSYSPYPPWGGRGRVESESLRTSIYGQNPGWDPNSEAGARVARVPSSESVQTNTLGMGKLVAKGNRPTTPEATCRTPCSGFNRPLGPQIIPLA